MEFILVEELVLSTGNTSFGGWVPETRDYTGDASGSVIVRCVFGTDTELVFFVVDIV